MSMIASNDILSNPANFPPPIPTSPFYAVRCKAGVAIAHVMMLNMSDSETMRFRGSCSIVTQGKVGYSASIGDVVDDVT